jgi:hypothetical protein
VFQFPEDVRDFIVFRLFEPALGLTRLPILHVWVYPSSEVKRSGCEADNFIDLVPI